MHRASDPAHVKQGFRVLCSQRSVWSSFSSWCSAASPSPAARSARSWKPIPHEMIIIGGAAVGALIVGNSMKELKQFGGGFGKVFKGPKYKKQDYLDAIFLVSTLMKMLRTDGPVALEPHIEDPKSSSDLRRISAAAQGSHARPPDRRHAAAGRGVVRHARPACGRGGDGQRAQDPPPRRRSARRTCSQTPGRRAARARHRRGRARRGEDDGLDRQAAGDPRRDDRLGAGRHLHGRAARLRHRRPVRQPLQAGDRGRRARSTMSSSRSSSPRSTAIRCRW